MESNANLVEAVCAINKRQVLRLVQLFAPWLTQHGAMIMWFLFTGNVIVGFVILFSTSNRVQGDEGTTEIILCRKCGKNWIVSPEYLKFPKKNKYNHIEIRLNTKRVMCDMDDRFLSFSIDAIEMKRKFRCFSMFSDKVGKLARALSPAYLRVGGTPQDFATFTTGDNTVNKYQHFHHDKGKGRSCEPHFKSWKKMKPFHLSIKQFGDIFEFANSSGLNLIFGVNALTQRNTDNSWDESNFLKVLKFSRSKDFPIAWELGNEPNRYVKYGKSRIVTPEQLASDYTKLRSLVHDDLLVGPSISSHNPKSLKYLKRFLASPHTTNSTTYHYYHMHESEATIDKYLDPYYLTKIEGLMHKMIMFSAGETSQLWLGEFGSSSGGGAKNLSDTYASGFLYLGTLGLASKLCHKVVIRQSLYGGFYGMLDVNTHAPLPDYWTSVLFKRLVGKQSLKVHIKNKNVALHAYCSRNNPDDVTLVAVNFHNKDAAISLRRYFRLNVFAYVLTANALTSKKVKLNGKILKLNKDKEVPTLKGDVVKQPLKLPGTSYGFFVVKGVKAKVCRTYF